MKSSHLKSVVTRQLLPALVVLVAGSVQAAENLARYNAEPAPVHKVRIEGSSTAHEWTMDGQLIGGSFELDPAFNFESPKPGKVNARAHAFITVRSIKSGKPKMDQRMQEDMKAKDNPRIEYRLTEMALKAAPASPGAPLQFDTKGELTSSGVTNKISMPVTIERVEAKKLKISGATPLKMTDYSVQPPAFSILGLGLMKTANEVKVSFEWVVTAAEAK